MSRLALGLVLLAVAAPTAFAGSAAPPRAAGPFLRGGDAYWVWKARGKPRSVVVFLHGLHQSELTPANHTPWIEHLAVRGNDVVYPRYEAKPGSYGAVRHIVVAVHAALARLGGPRVPLVVVGYSRGGRLAVEFAAVLPLLGATPAAVMSIFPSRLNPLEEERVDLKSLDPRTRILLVVGQEDSRDGAQELLGRLEQVSFPPAQVQAVMIRSNGSFHADHFSAMRTSAEAKRQFWDRLDRLIAGVT